MSIPRCLRLAGSACLFLGCLAGIPLRPALGATASPLPPDLPADARARLAAAAVDPALPSWQHDLMLDVPQDGGLAPPGPDPGTPALGEDPPPVLESDGVWTAFFLTRSNHDAIYDPLRDRMLVFGGGLFDEGVNDVWALSLGSAPEWTRLVPAGTPPRASAYSGAIYDPVRDRMLVFASAGSSVSCNDVWALSLAGTPAWTRLTPTGTPPTLRSGASVIYDPVRDRMVVFGGSYGSRSPQYLNDVWALSLGVTPAWTALTPDGTPPVARSGHGAIYDPVRDRMVVVGGFDGASSRNDLWALSLAGTPAWTQLTPDGPLRPAVSGRDAIYDPVRDRMVIGSAGPSVLALSLAGTPTWTQSASAGTPPGGRLGTSAIYDPVRDRMVVFGGGPSYTAQFFDDVWALSLADTPTWTQLTPAGTPPSPRYGHSAVYDPVRDRMVAFGGFDGSTRDYVNDVWALSLTGAPVWSELEPGGTPPAARSGHIAIYDPVRDRMVVVGGYAGSSSYNEAWALSLAGTPAWMQLAPGGTPPPAGTGRCAIYDPVRDRMLVFGGTTPTGPSNETWALSLEGTPVWTQVAPVGTPPSPRYGHSAVYDPVRDRMVVFAGWDGSFRRDVWALSLSGTPAWTQLTPTGTPPSARIDHSAIYDPVRDRMVVFGGYHETDNGAWGLTLAGTPAWTRLMPDSVPPSAKRSPTAIYDPVRDRMVVFGGTMFLQFIDDDVIALNYQDVWMLTWGTPMRDAAVDVRPGDDGNVVNPWAGGVLPVAILSEERFDATTVDPATVRLAGAGVRTRSDGTPMAAKEDVNGDGLADLLLHFESDALQLGTGDTLAHLTGMAPGNTTVRGTDRVRVVGRGVRRPVPEATAAGESSAPALLAVRSLPGGGVRVSLALAPGVPATLDLVDVAGRRVQAVTLDEGARGPREESLGGAGLAPGVYWVRLRQAGLAFTRKAVVLR